MSDKPVPAANYSEEYFLENCGGSEFFRRYGPEVLKPAAAYALARSGAAPGMKVLDAGCGRGELLYRLRKLGAEAIGTDYAPAAVDIAAKVSGCPVVRCDAKALPFKDAEFDRIFFIGVMDHLHPWELEDCFREFARCLKPGGVVIIHTCCNRSYYKNWTYAVRRALARILKTMGLPVREPSPPRSGEDMELHVNEHSRASIRDFFKRIDWSAEIEPRPNYKMFLGEIYGDPVPADLPIKPMSAWKKALYLTLLWRWPLKDILAREFFCIARPTDKPPNDLV